MATAWKQVSIDTNWQANEAMGAMAHNSNHYTAVILIFFSKICYFLLYLSTVFIFNLFRMTDIMK